jgi:ketosteroid isomerase-like protein
MTTDTMTTDTMISGTAASADTSLVRSVFAAFAAGDLAAIGRLFHLDATWNHRNQDRLGGLHHGTEEIIAFLAESARLSDGTLRPVPQSFLADGEGRVAVLVQVSGRRPDGRSFGTPQVALFTLDGGKVRSVDQFVGDPAAVTAFWA